MQNKISPVSTNRRKCGWFPTGKYCSIQDQAWCLGEAVSCVYVSFLKGTQRDLTVFILISSKLVNLFHSICYVLFIF
jgi:hypothetical protein